MITLQTFQTAWDADARESSQQPPLAVDELVRLCRNADPGTRPVSLPRPHAARRNMLRVAACWAVLFLWGISTYAFAAAPSVSAINSTSMLHHSMVSGRLDNIITHQ